MTTLEKKIEDLFVYRKFPLLFQLVNEKYENHPLINQLIDLQKAIYFLDHHLESNWKINLDDLKIYWEDIFKALQNIGLTKEEQRDYIKHLQKYQKHELYMREGKWPNRFDLNYFYFYKSCDVKMLRRIIYKFYPALHRNFSLADWRNFDLITEVNDDTEDVFEDQKTINGNNLLINIHLEGTREAEEIFLSFIDSIDTANQERLILKPKYQQIFDWTQQEIISTKKLLSKNLRQIDQSKEAPTSKISQYLPKAISTPTS